MGKELEDEDFIPIDDDEEEKIIDIGGYDDDMDEDNVPNEDANEIE